MRFTLVYRGPLPTSGKPSDKQRIREQLRPQIEELWTHEPLSGFRSKLWSPAEEGNLSALVQTPAGAFVTIVSRGVRLLAELDILLLRPERPGRIVVGGGDIDNRLKTLFDALRPPLTTQESRLTAAPPEADPYPVLLEDDDLITRVSVETDRLLDAQVPNEVMAVIRVSTHRSREVFGNQGL